MFILKNLGVFNGNLSGFILELVQPLFLDFFLMSLWV